MQPEPARFLRGVRLEILSAIPHLDTADPATASSILALRRGAIALTRLELRSKRLPERLESIRGKQETLLCSTFTQFRALELDVPAESSRNYELGRTLKGGESSIHAYELFASAQGMCLTALASASPPTAATRALATKLTHAMIDMESELRAWIKAAAQELDNADINAIQSPDHQVHTPTDAEFTAYLRRTLPEFPDLRAENLQVLKVYSANEINTLELEGHPDWPKRAILRRNRAFSSAKTSVASEFHVLKLLYDSGVAVPRPLLAEETGQEFQYPFILLERVAGAQRSIAELGPAAREVMTDFAKVLAKVHGIDPGRLIGQENLKKGPSLRERVLTMIDKYRRVWFEERMEPSLTLEAAYAWLPHHIEDIDPADGKPLLSIVHGDCDFRNMLIDGKRFSAMLDWELAHIGHPAEDLGYCRPDVESVMPWEEFIAAYRAAGGPLVDERAIRYFQVWNTAFRVTAGLTGTVSYCADIHADLTIGCAGFIDCQYWMGVLGECVLRADTARSQGR